MQNKVYRGVYHSVNSATSYKNINKINLNYRGIYFIK